MYKYVCGVLETFWRQHLPTDLKLHKPRSLSSNRKREKHPNDESDKAKTTSKNKKLPVSKKWKTLYIYNIIWNKLVSPFLELVTPGVITEKELSKLNDFRNQENFLERVERVELLYSKCVEHPAPLNVRNRHDTEGCEIKTANITSGAIWIKKSKYQLRHSDDKLEDEKVSFLYRILLKKVVDAQIESLLPNMKEQLSQLNDFRTCAEILDINYNLLGESKTVVYIPRESADLEMNNDIYQIPNASVNKEDDLNTVQINVLQAVEISKASENNPINIDKLITHDINEEKNVSISRNKNKTSQIVNSVPMKKSVNEPAGQVSRKATETIKAGKKKLEPMKEINFKQNVEPKSQHKYKHVSNIVPPSSNVKKINAQETMIKKLNKIKGLPSDQLARENQPSINLTIKTKTPAVSKIGLTEDYSTAPKHADKTSSKQGISYIKLSEKNIKECHATTSYQDKKEAQVKPYDRSMKENHVKASAQRIEKRHVKSSGEDLEESHIKSSDQGEEESLVKSSGQCVKESLVKSSGQCVKESLVKSSDQSVKESFVKSSGPGEKESLVKSSDQSEKESLVKSSDQGEVESPVKSSDLGEKESRVKSFEQGVKESLVKSSGQGEKESPIKSSDQGVKESLNKSSDQGLRESAVKSSTQSIETSHVKSSYQAVRESHIKLPEEGVKESVVNMFQDIKNSHVTLSDQSIKEGNFKLPEENVKKINVLSANKDVKETHVKTPNHGIKKSQIFSSHQAVQEGHLQSCDQSVKEEGDLLSYDQITVESHVKLSDEDVKGIPGLSFVKDFQTKQEHSAHQSIKESHFKIPVAPYNNYQPNTVLHMNNNNETAKSKLAKNKFDEKPTNKLAAVHSSIDTESKKDFVSSKLNKNNSTEDQLTIETTQAETLLSKHEKNAKKAVPSSTEYSFKSQDNTLKILNSPESKFIEKTIENPLLTRTSSTSNINKTTKESKEDSKTSNLKRDSGFRSSTTRDETPNRKVASSQTKITKSNSEITSKENVNQLRKGAEGVEEGVISISLDTITQDKEIKDDVKLENHSINTVSNTSLQKDKYAIQDNLQMDPVLKEMSSTDDCTSYLISFKAHETGECLVKAEQTLGKGKKSTLIDMDTVIREENKPISKKVQAFNNKNIESTVKTNTKNNNITGSLKPWRKSRQESEVRTDIPKVKDGRIMKPDVQTYNKSKDKPKEKTTKQSVAGAEISKKAKTTTQSKSSTNLNLNKKIPTKTLSSENFINRNKNLKMPNAAESKSTATKYTFNNQNENLQTGNHQEKKESSNTKQKSNMDTGQSNNLHSSNSEPNIKSLGETKTENVKYLKLKYVVKGKKNKTENITEVLDQNALKKTTQSSSDNVNSNANKKGQNVKRKPLSDQDLKQETTETTKNVSPGGSKKNKKSQNIETQFKNEEQEYESSKQSKKQENNPSLKKKSKSLDRDSKSKSVSKNTDKEESLITKNETGPKVLNRKSDSRVDMKINTKNSTIETDENSGLTVKESRKGAVKTSPTSTKHVQQKSNLPGDDTQNKTNKGNSRDTVSKLSKQTLLKTELSNESKLSKMVVESQVTEKNAPSEKEYVKGKDKILKSFTGSKTLRTEDQHSKHKSSMKHPESFEKNKISNTERAQQNIPETVKRVDSVSSNNLKEPVWSAKPEKTLQMLQEKHNQTNLEEQNRFRNKANNIENKTIARLKIIAKSATQNNPGKSK